MHLLPGATVLLIAPPLTDGEAGRATIDIAWALLQSGARAIVAAPDGGLAGPLQGFGGEWIRLDPGRANPFRRRQDRRRLKEMIGTERIDLVHARGVVPTIAAVEATKGSAARLVASYSCRPEKPESPSYIDALMRGARVIADSSFSADTLFERYPAAWQHTVVVPRPVDTRRFDPAAVPVERIAALRRHWSVRPGQRIALVPGRLDPDKGQLELVDAVRILTSGGLKHLVFVLAGDQSRNPAYARAVARYADAHGVGEWVRQVGICRDMPAAYAAADFVVVPAIRPPGIGRAAAEALAMGRPVLAAACGVLPEYVRAPPTVEAEARTGWLVERNDPAALARALAAAVGLDLAELRQMGSCARRLATSLLAPERVAAATLAVYSSLLERKA